MDNYISVMEKVLSVAQRLRRGEIALNEVPYESIMGIIKQVYDIAAGKGALFSELYGLLIVKGLEKSDAEEVATALIMLVRHFELIINDKNSIKELRNKSYHYQCRLAHLLNCDKVRRWHEINEVSAKVPFEGKGVIYTAITGNYDNVKEPKYINPDFDYILFTNNSEIKSDVWQVRLVGNEEQLDNVRLARKIKILGHEFLPEYDYSIWVDSKFEITDNLEEYMLTYRRHESILCFNHYTNDCVYKEKELCDLLKKDNSEIMKAQMDRYQKEGYPAENGLVESGILVRNLKDERLQQVMATWWREILNGSRRDQLSFNYACWKNDFMYDSTDLFIYDNKYVKVYDHN